MIYRQLAGEKVSQLGFGAMRLPTKGEGIDEAEAIRMIRRAIDGGINYVDTAWPYHGGQSELVVGKALRDGYRKRTFLATKSPMWLHEKPGDLETCLDKQLEKLQTDHIDFYLLHSLGAASWKKCRDFEAIDFCERMKKAGKIRHFGYSFHDEQPLFMEIQAAYDWEFCQIQYNILDRGYQAGQAGLEFATGRGTDVIIMEPLRGGNLAGPIPPGVQKLYDSASSRRSPVDWSLSWIWNRPEAKLILSGMSTMAQLEENLAIAGRATAESFSPADLAMMDAVETEYRRLIKVDCTACRYCMPCPAGVDIPRNFAVWNTWGMFGESELARGGYRWIPAAAQADKCVDCGQCEPQCPQQLPIRQHLKTVHADLAG